MLQKNLSLILCLSFIAISQFIYAQSTEGNGHFYGKIVDNESSKAIDGATVQLIQNKVDSASKKTNEIIIATLIANKNGDFSIENLPPAGDYTLKISEIGYKPLVQKVAFDFNTDKDLGNIKITADPEQLKNVTVNANKPLLELSLDKKIYHVEKDLSVTGGTAADVMKNVPSVNVDIDGNVTMRNASPQIFIDGRPTTLTLQQIPADQISTVEIMTNPSAKYDASGGGAGIINIVLKKTKKSGYNGNLSAGIDSRGMPNFGGDINIKQNKINFFASAQASFIKSKSTVNTERIDFLSPDTTAHYTQSNAPIVKGLFAYGRMGFDYFMDNRNTLTISGSAVNGNFKINDLINIYTDTITPSTSYIETADRYLKAKIDFTNYGSSIAYKHNFARTGKEWTADANFVYSQNANTSDYQSYLFDASGTPKAPVAAQRATGGGHANYLTIQTDYTDPFTKTQKIEFGFRAAIRNYYNWNDNYIQNLSSGIYNILPLIGVRYDFKDNVYAGYFTYSQQIKDFSYQGGLRIESSDYEGNFITKNTQFSTKYPFSLFPSLYMSYKLNEKQTMQVNYSRRINRPGFFQLVPFVDFSDSLNLSVGNPNLKPEFTNLFEIAYSNQYSPANSILISLYGNITTDLISRYQFDSLINPTKLARYTSYINANRSYTTGLEITGSNKISKWWNITSNLNLFDVEIKSGNLPGISDKSQFSWFAKLTNSFTLHKNYTVQLSGDYQAKTLIPATSPSDGGLFIGGVQTIAQGYIKPVWGADIAISKSLLKNKASLTVQFSDIFRSRISATHAATTYYIQDNRRIRDPQVLRLNFSWRFGKTDATLFKRKNLKGEMESIQGVQSAGQ